MRRLLGLLPLFGCAPERAAADYACILDEETVEREDGARIQALLDAAVADGIPGVTLAIRERNGPVWVGAAGYADLEAGAPMQGCTPTRVGAVSHMMAATATLALADDGQLDLETPVADLLDDADLSRVENIEQVTVRHLLSHTSGIPDYFLTACFLRLLNDPEGPITAEQAVRCMGSEPSDFSPGADFEISNSNYVLIGMLLEKVTGRTPSDVLRNWVTVPMSLSNTSLSPDGVAPDGTARGYGDLSGEGDVYDVTGLPLGYGLIDGGVVSTASELTLFAETLFADEFLELAWLREMKKETEIDGKEKSYGLGLQIVEDSPYGRAFGHQGLLLGYAAEVWYLPDARITVALTVNGSLGVLQERALQLSEDLAPVLLEGQFEEG